MKSLALCVFVSLLVSTSAKLRAQQAEDRVQFGRDLQVERGQILGDAVCFFCSIRVRGTLTGDAVAFGDDIEVEGVVAGDAIAVGGAVKLGPGAKVGGELVAAGGPVEKGPLSAVGGEVTASRWFYLPGQWKVFTSGVLGLLVFNLALVSICYSIARRRLEVMAESVRERAWFATLAGFTLVVIFYLLLAFTPSFGRFTGVWVWPVQVTFLVTFAFGYSSICFAIGRRIASKKGAWAAVLSGASLVTAAELIPIAGFIALSISALPATGVAPLSGFGKATDWLPKLFSRQPPAFPPAA